ncbi:MAG: 4Fe-4S dicluster domain-containing protein [Ruminococcus sp.]|nr:4Fe-4S dicluster domain-containing protein [Ruminococcus sp.]MBR6599214.1 4Fe-4S binding protein [Oscillospiraceae bacterium]
MGAEFYHSVHLDVELCKGCINCIKRCPTQAIRVQHGKAKIIKEYCIDCGECIRICPHHAKSATYDSIDILKKYEYTVALPAPSLYAQFNNLDDIDIVLSALKSFGFDDTYEVSAAAEMVSEMSRNYIKKHREDAPFISTACPTVVRLIRVRFPNLLDHLLPFAAPVELAAQIAVKNAMEKSGLPREKIGIIFISPCPAKVTACKDPIGNTYSEVDGVIAIKDIYPLLLPHMKSVASDPEKCSVSGRIGVGWGNSGGESAGLLTDNYLAADGIENVIRVLEDLEDQKFGDLEFIELGACNGGCVGGVLCVENPYVAQSKLKKLCKYLPISRNHLGDEVPQGALFETEIEYEPVYKIGKNLAESLALMARIDELCKKFPGLDCGSCGAPTCRALAEDIARGFAREGDCIPLLKESILNLSETISPNQ